MKLWTVWQTYGATGEGQTFMASIAPAADQQEALVDFGREFEPFLAGDFGGTRRVSWKQRASVLKMSHEMALRTCTAVRNLSDGQA